MLTTNPAGYTPTALSSDLHSPVQCLHVHDVYKPNVSFSFPGRPSMTKTSRSRWIMTFSWSIVFDYEWHGTECFIVVYVMLTCYAIWVTFYSNSYLTLFVRCLETQHLSKTSVMLPLPGWPMMTRTQRGLVPLFLINEVKMLHDFQFRKWNKCVCVRCKYWSVFPLQVSVCVWPIWVKTNNTAMVL